MFFMQINDLHLHMGQFYERYYSPEFIYQAISDNNINKALISSTTTCEENYAKVISEIHQLIVYGKEKIFPVLWVTPKMIKSNNLAYMLESNIQWKCIKIHGLIHNWAPNGKLFKQVIDLAIKIQLPILIHSGGDKRCDAGSYLRIIKNNPQQTFILAHGRPIDEAINVIKHCTNAYVDTAFMSLEHIVLLIENKLEERILFGSDFPITIHNESNIYVNDWYQNRISEIVDIIGIDKFKIMNEYNFNKLFC